MKLFSLLAFDNLTPMNWETLEPALNFLWQGLLAIFIVIGLIVIAVKITSAVIAACEESKKSKVEKEENEKTNTNE